MIFNKIIKDAMAQSQADRKAELYRNLIRHEAKLGGQLFGPVPDGHRREFFCLDRYTWVWHEEWRDQQGQPHTKTTRYDIRPDGVIKSQNGHYQPVSKEEARHLRDAIRMYGDKVDKELYSRIPLTTPKA